MTETMPEGLGLDLPNMMQRPTELGAVITMVEQNLGRQPRSLLEIGVWQGGTLTRFSRRWPQAIPLGIDPNPIELDVSLIDRVVVGRSQDQAVRLQVEALAGEVGWEFVHIDGDHHYEEARADYEWARDVLGARVIALHDVAPFNHPDIEVWRLWHEIKCSGIPCVEIRHDAAGNYGYGVVFARG
jgi:cephalosporin hydroxylase